MTAHDGNQVPGAGLVSAEERALLAEAIAHARGGTAHPDELEAVAAWVTRSRVNFVLTEGWLEGLMSVRMENGEPVFRGRTPGDVPPR